MPVPRVRGRDIKILLSVYAKENGDFSQSTSKHECIATGRAAPNTFLIDGPDC